MSSCKSPICITESGSNNICRSKCNLNYAYSFVEMPLKISNYQNYLNVDYTNSNTDNTIQLDETSYNLSYMNVYSPSLHQFGSNSSNDCSGREGEIQIYHTSKNNTNPLIICIMFGSDCNGSTNMGLNNLIDTSTVHASKSNTGSVVSTTTIVPGLNLNSFIGSTPYYTYTGTKMGDCNQEVDYIVYHPVNFSILITPDYKDKLTSVIDAYSTRVVPNVAFFYNPDGPNYSSINEIYMDCSPSNISETTESVAFFKLDKNNGAIDAVLNFIYICVFLIIVFGIVFLVIFMIDKMCGYADSVDLTIKGMS